MHASVPRIRSVVTRLSAVTVLSAAALVAAPLAAAAPAAAPVGSAAASACRSGTQHGGSEASGAAIADLRVGRHAGFDRLVLQFDRNAIPSWRLTPKARPVFVLDPSGRTVRLRGHAGLRLRLFPATTQGGYDGPRDVKTSFPQLREVRVLGDFEAVTTLGLGLRHATCAHVFRLRDPGRLVIDIRH